MELIDSGQSNAIINQEPSDLSLMMRPGIKRNPYPMKKLIPAVQSVRPVSPVLERQGAPIAQPEGMHRKTPTKVIPLQASDTPSTDVSGMAADNFTTAMKLLVIALVIFIVFHFWQDSIKAFLSQKIYAGKEIPWKHYLLASVVLTLILVIIAYFIVPTGQGKYDVV